MFDCFSCKNIRVLCSLSFFTFLSHLQTRKNGSVALFIQSAKPLNYINKLYECFSFPTFSSAAMMMMQFRTPFYIIMSGNYRRHVARTYCLRLLHKKKTKNADASVSFVTSQRSGIKSHWQYVVLNFILFFPPKSSFPGFHLVLN